MLITHIFPVGSQNYKRIRRWTETLDVLKTFKPRYWFGFWCIILSGTNVAYAVENRWLYWDFTAISFLVILAMILVIPWTKIFFHFSLFPKRVDTFPDALYVIVIGFILYLLGTLDKGISLWVIYGSLPYLFIYLAMWIVFSIPLNTVEQGRLSAPRSKPVTHLLIVLVLTLIAAVAGYIGDDPVSSTAAAVYLPFPFVTLVFPNRVRHYQRARIYGVFIPVVFIGMRFPWFFIPLAVLFWGLRYYHYFRFGVVYPTFKVDLE